MVRDARVDGHSPLTAAPVRIGDRTMSDASKTLRVVNLPRREAKEVGLLLPLVGIQTGTDWRLSEHSGAHVAMVDLDVTDADQAMFEARAKSGVVITISTQTGSEGIHIERPLRTQKFVVALKDALQRLGDGPRNAEATKVGYRLVRWPTAGTLRRDQRLIRVCGALNSSPKPLDAVASRTSIDPDELVRLLEMLSDAGCITTTELPSEEGKHVAEAEHPGLFAKLRARLGRS